MQRHRRRYRWQSGFTASEYYRGWVYFGLYLLVFPIVMGRLQQMLSQQFDFFLQAAQFSLIYYFLLVCTTVLLFWSFLRRNFDILLDRLPENLIVLLTGLVAAGLLHRLVMLIPYPLENPNLLSYPSQYLMAPVETVVIFVILMPIVEEPLFRGLLFGGLRGYSRVLAFVVSTLAYALFCVIQFVFSPVGINPLYLLLIVQYLPMSLVLTWSYDQGGSIWSVMLLHMGINAMTLALAV